MYDDAYTRNENDELAVRTVSVNEGSGNNSYDDVFTRDENGKLALRVTGSGGGGSSLPDQTGHSGEFLTTDGFVAGWAKTEQIQREVLPQADENEANKIYEYVGATDATYTNGYFYKCVGTTTYSSTVSFEAATLSSSTIACSGDDFAAFVAEWGSGDITTITNGTLTYDQSGGLLVFVGKDAEDTTVCTFQLYTEDYQDAGFTITGTLQDGDVIAFTCSIEEVISYSWTRVDVQPTPEALPDQTGQSGKFLTTNGTSASWGTVESLPSQTGQSGKFLTTDGTDASWGNALVNSAVSDTSLSVYPKITTDYSVVFTTYTSPSNIRGNYATGVGYSIAMGANSVVIGASGRCLTNSVVIGANAEDQAGNVIAIGRGALVKKSGAILLNASGTYVTNTTANTFKVANANGNFMIMDANGNLPADRLASTSGLADGNYRLRLTMASGVPTLSWVAE